jgi:hypothetical protein
MQVFISYAHTPADTALARYLAERLRACAVDVWLDEASLKAGELLQAEIEEAIAASQAGIFIVTPSWLMSEWTAFELEQFDKRDPRIVKRIPILRIPRERLNVPPALVKIKGLIWLEEDTEADARFWELHCALSDTNPGPSDQWPTRGRALSKTPVPLPAPAAARPAPSVRASLRCDRAPQWKTVDDLATEGSNEIILLPGGAGQAHDHFLERIQRLLRMDPPRSVTTVDWPTRPRSRDEFREALARALATSPADLAAEIGARLAHANLMLLHPCIRARFVDDRLVQYYTKWLPELLDESRPRMNLKCVQPIEWPPEAGLGAQLMTWLRLRGASHVDAHPQAETLIELVKAKATDSLRAIRLHDLTDITDDDLSEFCELMKLKDHQKSWFLSHINARQPRTPIEVFQAIDDYLPDARSLA